MARAIARCPVCEDALRVTELACDGCGTTVRNRFEQCRFCGISLDHAAFLEVFLRNRGNLSGVASDLGLSFPTVSRRLDGLLTYLGLRSQTVAPSGILAPAGRDRDTARKRILEMLDRGDITADDATRRIRDI
jgi:hypothetical protein